MKKRAISIYFGYRLFSTGAGLFKAVDRLAIQTPDFKISIAGMGAGGFLILASLGWAGGAVYSVPMLATTGSDGSHITVGELQDLIGSPAYAADRQLVGNIRALILNDPTKSPEAIVDTMSGYKSVGSLSFSFDKSTGTPRATIHLTRGEIEKLPTVVVPLHMRVPSPPSGGADPQRPNTQLAPPSQILPAPAIPWDAPKAAR